MLKKKTAAAILTGVLSMAALADRPPTIVNEDGDRIAQGRVLVMPRAGLPAAEFAKILALYGAHAARIGNLGAYSVELPSGVSERDVAAAIGRHPHIRFAELDRVVKPSFAPNDPAFALQYHLPLIGAPAAWNTSQGQGVVIAIVDTGVNVNHPDLSIAPGGYNFYANTTDVSDVFGHGTLVAGTAAAVTNNLAGVAGVAGQAKVLPLRVSDDQGDASFSDMARAIGYAADHGARVANLSFDALNSATIETASQTLRSRNGLLVSAAGNTGANNGGSAASTIVVVSGTDAADARASFSSFGPGVKIAAPAVDIYATWVDGSYGKSSGTSFASPIVAGAVAAVMAANPALAPAQVESILYATARDLGTPGRDDYFGAGRVDVAAAVAAALPQGPDVTVPNVAITSPASGTTVRGIVVVGVAASDNVAVSKVDMLIDGALYASDVTSPYSFSVDTRATGNGPHTLTARAYDTSGNTNQSSIAVVVANDLTPPVLTITSPSAGKVTKTVLLSAKATDNVGVTSMAVAVDGVQKATATKATISYNWNTNGVAVGPHLIMFTAGDAAGNVATATVTVTK